MSTVMSLEDFAALAKTASPSSVSKPSWHVIELGKTLLRCAREGDTEQVLHCISKGAPFSTDWLGTSALHLAAINNHASTCKVLLRAGISRDTRTKVERTPLHLAAYEGHEEICNILLNAGALVDCKDMLNMTPLHWAVEKGHINCVKLLLEQNALPNETDNFFRTPSIIATDNERWDILELLELALATAESEKKSEEIGKQTELKNSDENAMEEEKTAEDTQPKILENILLKKFNNASSTQDQQKENSAAAKLLRSHGISMQPATHPNTILSAITSGRTVVLSDACKLLLKENSESQAKSLPIPPKILPKNLIKIVAVHPTIDKETGRKIIKKVLKVSRPTEYGSVTHHKSGKKETVMNLSQLQELQKKGLIQLKSAGGGVKGAVKIVTNKRNLDMIVHQNSGLNNTYEDPLSQLLSADKSQQQSSSHESNASSQMSEVERLRRELQEARTALVEKEKLIEELKSKVLEISGKGYT